MKFKLLSLLFVSLIFISCESYQSRNKDNKIKDFILVESNYKFKRGAFAVVPGAEGDENILLVKYITDSLKNNSKFKVVDSKKIYKLLPNEKDIVVKINVVASKKQKKTSHLLFEKSKKNVDDFQKKLQTKYILLIWTSKTESLYNVSSFDPDQIHNIMINARLIEYPAKKIIGYTSKTFSINSDDDSLVYKNNIECFQLLIKKSAERIAKKIIQIEKK